MKKVFIITMAMICCGHMQAEGWFANWLNRIKESPYSGTSLRRLAPEDAARRVHAMQFLYPEDKLTSLSAQYTPSGGSILRYELGNLNPYQQEAVSTTYPRAFSDEFNESRAESERLLAIEKILAHIKSDPERPFLQKELPVSLNHLTRVSHQRRLAEEAKQQEIFQKKEAFLKQLAQEARTSSAPCWLETQRRIQHHPDYFEY